MLRLSRSKLINISPAFCCSGGYRERLLQKCGLCMFLLKNLNWKDSSSTSYPH
jgi:hypothetical protein